MTARTAPVIFALPAGYSPSASHDLFQCGANARHNRWQKAAIVKQLRGDAKQIAQSQRLPRLDGPVNVLAVQHPAPGARTRDVENIAPLVKTVIDGLRDAGVLVNDSAKYVAAVTYTVGERVPRGQLVLHISPIPADTSPDHATGDPR